MKERQGISPRAGRETMSVREGRRAVPRSARPLEARGRGISLIELLLGVTLFVMMFSHIMMAFAPTATDYHGLVRGYTVAINISTWYLNRIEGLIDFEGRLPAAQMGLDQDVTTIIRTHFPASKVELPDLKVKVNTSQIGAGLYQIEINITWKAGAKNRHEYSMKRLKAAPSY